MPLQASIAVVPVKGLRSQGAGLTLALGRNLDCVWEAFNGQTLCLC
jgi:hypothetical protein